MKKLTVLLTIILVSIYGLKAQIAWSQNGSNLYYNGGNVGIGTTAPSYPLDIFKQIDGLSLINVQNTSEVSGCGSGIRFFTRQYGGGGSWWSNIVLKGDRKLHFNMEQKEDAMLIDQAGNVGIGTTTPIANLSVTNRFLVSADGVVKWGASGAIHGILSWDTERAIIGGQANQGLALYTNGNEKVRILPNGNVGIGTTTPSNSLTLSKMLNGANLARITFDGQTGDANNTINGGVEFHNDNYNYFSSIYGYRGDDSHQAGLQLKTSSGTAMIILPNMNIGLGITNPQYKLTVEGTIAAREVKVTAESWADFVFHPSYKLRSLGEVEQFIKTNSHLPEIPTTTEVKENGVSLGEMNAKLLQKIEELTLYVIELKKENEVIKQEINNLKK